MENEQTKHVKIVRPSVKYNAHINNIGAIARVDEECEDGYQVTILEHSDVRIPGYDGTGGAGMVDKAACEPHEEPLTSHQSQASEQHPA